MSGHEETPQDEEGSSDSAEGKQIDAEVLYKQEEVGVGKEEPNKSEYANFIEQAQVMSNLADYVHRVQDHSRLDHVDYNEKPRADFSLDLQLLDSLVSLRVIRYEEIWELHR